jgi:hypothetical protein
MRRLKTTEEKIRNLNEKFILAMMMRQGSHFTQKKKLNPRECRLLLL